MKTYTPQEIEKAKAEIAAMDHETMCRVWRHGGEEYDIYFRSDLPTSGLFTDRLFRHFGGFTPQLSKKIGWKQDLTL